MTDIPCNPLTGLPIEDSQLSDLSSLCDEQLKLETRIEDGEKLLKQLKERHKILSENLIPDRMDQLGLKSISLSNGAKVTVKPYYYGKILSPAGYEWLDQHGHGGIIKTVVQKSFSRDKRDEAVTFAKENNLELVETVHHSTMAAFVKEIYSDPENERLPENLFSVYQGNRTKIS